ncbi:hypothetical protein [Marinoscillum sp.]|uniref:hypothetical protein n=1 Tax=Marinoscillum sp. TaxID=2024838 RepID=UPI003BA9441E
MMKVNQLLIAGFLGATLISCTQKPASIPEHIRPDWAKNELWDDGKAEVAIYHAERVVYGEPRQFDYVYVLVKETFNQEYKVKTDDYDRSDLYEVMKVNKFCRIQTLKYPYHYLTSVFYNRNNPSLVHKLTNTSQEWCGNTAKSFLENGAVYDFQYMSYWDGQGNGLVKVDKGPWFEDQLSYTLRTLDFKAGLSFEVDLYPMQVTSKATIPKAEQATISVEAANQEDLVTLDSTFVQAAWQVNVARDEGANLTFWIGKEYPNYLLRMEATDGRKLMLKSLERDDYWAYE